MVKDIIPDDSISQISPNYVEDRPIELEIVNPPTEKQRAKVSFEVPPTMSSTGSKTLSIPSSNSLTKAKKREAFNDLNSSLLLHEVKEEFQDSVLAEKIDNKLVLIGDKDSFELFKKIKEYRSLNISNNAASCLDKFAHMLHSDALVKIAYGIEGETCISYGDTDPSLSQTRISHIVTLLSKNLFLVLEISALDTNMRFIKIYGSFETMAKQAENINLSFQLSATWLRLNINYNPVPVSKKKLADADFDTANDRVYNERKRSALFRYSDLDDFKYGEINSFGIKAVKEHFFTPEKRNYLVNSLVLSTKIPHELNSMTECSVLELVEMGTYQKYFSLHDSSIELFSSLDGMNWKGTRLSLKNWATRFSFSGLPLNEIKDYFGINVAFYFAWLEFYSNWLKILALIGLATTGYGVYLRKKEVGSISVFDNVGTIIYAFLSSIWALLFLKFWKRQSNYLAYVWDSDKLPRADYTRTQWKPNASRISKITGKQEGFESPAARKSKRVTASVIVTILLVLFIAIVGANVAFLFFLLKSDALRASAYVNVLFLSVVEILVLGPVCYFLAVRFTKLENYRMFSDFMNSFIIKDFIMRLPMAYGFLLFFAVIKPVATVINPEILYFGYKSSCKITATGFNSCFADFLLALVVIFGAQHFILLVYSILENMVQKKSDLLIGTPQYQSDSEAPTMDCIKFSENINTKILNFGYFLLFAGPVPLAPIFGVLTNTIDIKVELWKFSTHYQRPFSELSHSFRTWQRIVSVLVYIGLITNSTILAFTSNAAEENILPLFSKIAIDPTQTLFLRFGFVFMYQNLMLLINLLINIVIDDVPASVSLGKQSEKYIEKVRSSHKDSNSTEL